MKNEPFVTPKELGGKLEELGLCGYGTAACRHLVSSMKASGMTIMRGKSVRPSEAFAFLEANPRWRPFSKQTVKTRAEMCR